MSRRVWCTLIAAVLLAGCTGKPSASPPAPVVTTEAPTPAPAPPTDSAPPTPPADDQVALPKLALADVLAVNVWLPDANRNVQLLPTADGSLIDALVSAVGAAGTGRLRTEAPNVRLTASILLRSGDMLVLTLQTGAGAVSGVWKDQHFYIADAAIAQALEALGTQVASMPKEQPGTRLWAIDPTGKKKQETLFEYPESLYAYGASPDGRYLLLVKALGEGKGDFRAVPYLWDRTTGKLTKGKETLVRFAQWSGQGFFINVAAHLDLSLAETRLDSLAAVLGDKSNGFLLPAVSFTPDGKRFAAVVNGEGEMGTVDLLTGNVDGTDVARVPHAGVGNLSENGTVAFVSLSPDGKFATISDKSGTRIAPVGEPDTQKWVPVQGGGLGVAWAPDSKHLLNAPVGVLDLGGKVTATVKGYGMLWRPDGQGSVVYDSNVARLFTSGGQESQLPLPDWSIPVAFLPDGRLLVWHMARP